MLWTTFVKGVLKTLENKLPGTRWSLLIQKSKDLTVRSLYNYIE